MDSRKYTQMDDAQGQSEAEVKSEQTGVHQEGFELHQGQSL